MIKTEKLSVEGVPAKPTGIFGKIIDDSGFWLIPLADL